MNRQDHARRSPEELHASPVIGHRGRSDDVSCDGREDLVALPTNEAAPGSPGGGSVRLLLATARNNGGSTEVLATPQPILTDCSPSPTWRLIGCVVYEGLPDDAALASECELSADAERVRLRVRRSGEARDGRTCELLGIATDACGNESAPQVVARFTIPHDERPETRCPR